MYLELHTIFVAAGPARWTLAHFDSDPFDPDIACHIRSHRLAYPRTPLPVQWSDATLTHVVTPVPPGHPGARRPFTLYQQAAINLADANSDALERTVHALLSWQPTHAERGVGPLDAQLIHTFIRQTASPSALEIYTRPGFDADGSYAAGSVEALYEHSAVVYWQDGPVEVREPFGVAHDPERTPEDCPVTLRSPAEAAAWVRDWCTTDLSAHTADMKAS